MFFLMTNKEMSRKELPQQKPVALLMQKVKSKKETSLRRL